MTIKAVLRQGVIQPIEPLPADWVEGQELVVEEPRDERADAEIGQWAREMDAAVARIPADEHDRFLEALDGIERESKDAVRKEWGVP